MELTPTPKETIPFDDYVTNKERAQIDNLEKYKHEVDPDYLDFIEDIRAAVLSAIGGIACVVKVYEYSIDIKFYSEYCRIIPLFEIRCAKDCGYRKDRNYDPMIYINKTYTKHLKWRKHHATKYSLIKILSKYNTDLACQLHHQQHAIRIAYEPILRQIAECMGLEADPAVVLFGLIDDDCNQAMTSLIDAETAQQQIECAYTVGRIPHYGQRMKDFMVKFITQIFIDIPSIRCEGSDPYKFYSRCLPPTKPIFSIRKNNCRVRIRVGRKICTSFRIGNAKRDTRKITNAITRLKKSWYSELHLMLVNTKSQYERCLQAICKARGIKTKDPASALFTLLLDVAGKNN